MAKSSNFKTKKFQARLKRPVILNLQSAAPRRQATAGFTIIETMIVMAIAGLILLIVFEVIPVLQRNARNDQRKQDVQTILSAVSHYELNDSGGFPTNCGGSGTAPLCTSGDGHAACSNSLAIVNPNDYFLQCVANKLTLYTDSSATDTDQVVLVNQSAGATPSPNPVTNADVVYVYNYQKCNGSNTGSTWQGAGYADIVALYALESGNNTTSSQCQQL